MQWIAFGWSLVYSDKYLLGKLPVVGGLDMRFLRHTSSESAYYGGDDDYISAMTMCLFKMAVAIVGPSIVSAGASGRMRAEPWLVFTILWATLVYDPVAYMVWNDNGLLYKLGCKDFAGGIVLHLTSGVSSLMLSLLLGPTQDFKLGIEAESFHLGFAAVGGSLLWVGNLALNGASEFGAYDNAVRAVLNTQMACSAAVLVWFIVERIFTGTASCSCMPAVYQILKIVCLRCSATYRQEHGTLLS